MKRVAVLVRSAAERGAEALRGAVGLAAGGLAVRVLLVEDGVFALTARDTDKPIGTLRLLGHEVMIELESLASRNLSAMPWMNIIRRDQLPELLASCDAVEAWR